LTFKVLYIIVHDITVFHILKIRVSLVWLLRTKLFDLYFGDQCRIKWIALQKLGERKAYIRFVITKFKDMKQNKQWLILVNALDLVTTTTKRFFLFLFFRLCTLKGHEHPVCNFCSVTNMLVLADNLLFLKKAFISFML